VTGSFVAREEPLKFWLSARPVLWFQFLLPFLFNGAVAVAGGMFMHGTQGMMTAAGVGLVSLGAVRACCGSVRPPRNLSFTSQRFRSPPWMSRLSAK